MPSGPPSNAWAGGSALAFRTGYLDDWLQFEAAGATSQPLYAPAGEGGTLLLTDNQAEISSFAIANAKLRGLGQELIVGRQLVKTPYINPQDNRMLPNAVEGAVLMRRRDEAETFDYGIGYLWGFKARDSYLLRAVLRGARRRGGSRRAGGGRQGGADPGPHASAPSTIYRRRPQHDLRGSRLDHSRRSR